MEMINGLCESVVWMSGVSGRGWSRMSERVSGADGVDGGW